MVAPIIHVSRVDPPPEAKRTTYESSTTPYGYLKHMNNNNLVKNNIVACVLDSPNKIIKPTLVLALGFLLLPINHLPDIFTLLVGDFYKKLYA
jgi:uncharacterized membrane protein YkvA (DUF1232 family)